MRLTLSKRKLYKGCRWQIFHLDVRDFSHQINQSEVMLVAFLSVL